MPGVSRSPRGALPTRLNDGGAQSWRLYRGGHSWPSAHKAEKSVLNSEAAVSTIEKMTSGMNSRYKS